ncbi:MAG: SDR family oxidoreductase [uncultured Sulfurovum sp.]|uniref:SDR family oxidoreductase n=1 Tax=uncultured Sulfurovum sp. TaxID=269237 RepID=A0A6S6TN47_9BACT|nr:MAG: SDR family oxidoreductase [uncultured Sulfurovum sp.]
MSETLNGKVAVITGGAKNLGGLTSINLAKAGADVLIHYHGDNAKVEAETTAKTIRELGRKVSIFQGDLSKPEVVTAMFEQAKKELGGVDIAVNNVGMVLRKPIVETTEKEYDTMFNVNTKSAYFFIKEAGKQLNDNGKIISIVTSLLGAFTDGYSTYAGAKASVEHFTRAAAKEFGVRGISVTSIAPGPMDTPFFYAQETPERVAYHKSNGIGNQLTQIEDIVPIVKFLATEGWWITGQTIFANGGYTTR